MAVTLNASTSAGLVQTADTSGVLALQTAGTTAVTVDASQNVGIGTTPSSWNSSAKTIDIATGSSLVDFSSQTWLINNLFLNSAGNWTYKTTNASSFISQSAGQVIFYRTASGTAGNTATLIETARIDSNGNLLIGVSATSPVWDERLSVRLDTTGTGQVAFGAYSASTSYASSLIRVQAENATGTAWNILDGRGNGGAVKVTIDGNGKGSFLGGAVVNGVNGLGYATGAGGTVTQATNKSTGVTLNKPTGQITMSNAALGANTNVNFTLTNSLITSSADVIVVNDVSGMAAYGTYSFFARAQGAGSAVISVRNVTSGSLSEAIVLSFVIIKGSTS
jgi:hypothetical protein